MNEKRAWQRVASMERRAKNYKKNVKQKCVRSIAKGILRSCKVPIYKTDQNGQLLIDQDGKKIPKERSYKNKDGQKVTHIKTRKLMGFNDFKKHFVIIPKNNSKKLQLVVNIVELITKINELESRSIDLNQIKNNFNRKLQSVRDAQINSDQSSDQQINNQDQDNQIDPDKEKNQNSDQNNFNNPSSDFSGKIQGNSNDH